MKRISMVILAGLMLAGALASWSMAGAEAASSAPAPPRIAVRGLDPIEFIAGQEVPGDPKIYADHNKLRYVFANQKNRAQFKKDPVRYGIQGDGTCPVAPKDQANPDYVMVYNGKIYAFASVGCMVPFSENPEKYLARWPHKAKKG